MSRLSKRIVRVASLAIGGGHPILIQSMTNTDTRDTSATLCQISSLAGAGCQLVRVAVPNEAAAECLPTLIKGSSVPLVADIHFDYRLALKSIRAGIAKLRINPGNIGGIERVREVASAAKLSGVPIRIGVNAGSLEREVLAEHGKPTAEAMLESAARHIRLLEDVGFTDIVLSLKASDVLMTVEAYRLASQRFEYPLHIGVTEAGTVLNGAVRSSIGLSLLLAEGIGDTVRVSLTGDPIVEVRVARTILSTLGLAPAGPRVISCPTCGRCRIDVAGLASEVEDYLQSVDKPITVAVMGCAVNGPGEAREADVGLAGGEGEGLLFVKGRIVGKVPSEQMVDALKSYITAYLATSE